MASDYTELRKEYLKTWRIWYVINQRSNPEWRKRYLPRHKSTYFAVCDEWSKEESGEEGFINFFACVGDLEHVSDLHRKDTTKPYGPRNIIKGDTYSRTHRARPYLTEQAHYARVAVNKGIPKWCYYRRIERGMTPKQAAAKAYKRTRTA